ncbi:RNA polymerase II transcription factor B subunit 4 [Cryptotrichosporon argae]
MAPSLPQPTTASRDVPATVPSTSLLIAILDLHPLAWSLLSGLSPAAGDTAKVPVAPLTLDDFVTNVIVFLNAHLASGWGNEVVVYGATAGKAVMLYPSAEVEEPRPRPNFYAPFNSLGDAFERRLKAVAEEASVTVGGKSVNDPPALVSALAKALCHINSRRPPEAPASALTDNSAPITTEARILVLNATPGGPPGSAGEGGAKAGGGQGAYVGLMNCVFAAQKAKIPIDVLTLPPESTRTAPPIFLQQASYLTEGLYWRWNGRGGLLQYLHMIYLTPPSLRHTPFTSPPQDAVDFRAVCFCHHQVVDVGFVCSVCLSIFCKPIPVCQMCKTRFPVKSHATLAAHTADIAPIPVPATLVAKPGGRRTSVNRAGGAGAGAAGGNAEADAIVVE